jgi:hypothetical protein
MAAAGGGIAAGAGGAVVGGGAAAGGGTARGFVCAWAAAGSRIAAAHAKASTGRKATKRAPRCVIVWILYTRSRLRGKHAAVR